MPDRTTVRISAPVYPTESETRVADAIRALFPNVQLETEGARVVGELASVQVLGELIQRLRIPDTARGQLYKGRDENRTVVFLHKQAATVGRFNFAATPGPLGDIRLEIEAPSPDELERIIDAIAPDTKDPDYEDPGFEDPDARADDPEDTQSWREVEGPWKRLVEDEQP